jgi:RimJ/RimL family protein N-acetyltransferase
MTLSDNVKLRGFKIEDANRITELCNNKKIWDNVKDIFPHPYKLSDAIGFIEHCNNKEIQSTFIIEYNNEIVGTIGLIIQSDIYRLSAELGYWIGEPFWGKGIATRAVNIISDYGFNELGLIRIYSGVFEYNITSMKVLEKAGYELECIARNAIIKNGTICNGHRYAKIKTL